MQHDVIGNYRVLQKIGAGGMAKVYLAVHVDIPNLKVILKILEDPLLVDRFRQEADKLALLDGNSKVCQIKHFFSHGDEFVIAMEYIDGESLEKRVKDLGRLPIPEAVRIMSEVLDVLDFAHSKEIYHRDIKPSNIMVDKRGMVKVIDFGIAKGKSDPDLTIAGTACGTPAYMAPEQFTPTPSTNYSVIDIYAVGTTLFNLITGDLPFKADNEFLLRDAKLFSDPTSPRSLNPDIPKALEEVILKSLKRTPTERFTSAAAMKKALEAVPIPRETASNNERTVAIHTSASVASGRRSRTGLFAMIGAAVVVVAAGGYWVFGRGSSRTDVKDSVVPSTTVDSSKMISQGNESSVMTTPAQNTQQAPAEKKSSGADTTHRTVSDGSAATNKSPKTVDTNRTVSAPAETPKTVVTSEVRIGSGSYPGAKIFINGKLQEDVTPYTFKLAPGQYRIEVRADVDGKPMSRDTSITIEAGANAKVNLRFDQ